MTTPYPDNNLYRRVSALEAAVEEIQRAIEVLSPAQQAAIKLEPAPLELEVQVLDSPIAPLVPQPVTVAMADKPATQAPQQRLYARAICTHCQGGNPPDAHKCMWCGKAMSPVVAAVPLLPIKRESAEQLQSTAAPTRVKAVPLGTTSDRVRPGIAYVRMKDAPLPRPAARQKQVQEVRQPLSTTIIRAAEKGFTRIGIVLFLLGVAFLFKYSLDKGWLNEQVRVGIGLASGAVLMVAGLRLHGKRRYFSQVLMGGSIATYYITGYAAYNLFPALNIPFGVAFGFMTLVTLAAFALSVRQDEAILSLIGVAGGLLTPFVLNQSQVGLPGVVGYMCLVTLGASGIYLVKGWRSLLWTSVVATWAVLIYGFASHILFVWPRDPFDQWSLQGGAVFALFAFWAVPVLREVLSSRNPARWHAPDVSLKESGRSTIMDYQAPLLTLAMPILALIFSAGLWSGQVTMEVWGATVLGVAALFAGVYFLLRRYAPTLSTLAYTHVIVAVGLLTTGLSLLLHGDTLLLALAIEGAALHLLARRTSDTGMVLFGNIIFSGVAAWLVSRLLPGVTIEHPFWNSQALTDFAVLAIAFGTSFVCRERYTGLIMRSAVHLAVMALLWREVHAIPDGDGYVMLAWAAYGLALHVISSRVSDSLNSVGTSIMAHLAFEGALGLLAVRLVTGQEGDRAIFNAKAVLDLGVMALALAASFVVKNGKIGSLPLATIYRLGIHVAMLGWLWREATVPDPSLGYLMLRWAAYLTLVAFVSHRIGDRITLIFTAIPFVAVGAMLAVGIVGGHEGDLAIWNAKTLIDVAVIGLALATSFVMQPREVRIAFRLAIHAGVLGLLWRELFFMENVSNNPFFSFIGGHYGYAMLASALYLGGLHLLAKRTRDEATSIFAHMAFLWVAGLLAWRLAVLHEMTVAIFNWTALINVAVIAIAASVSFVVRPKSVGLFYRYAVHVAMLACLAVELFWLQHGDGYVMLAWAAYGTLLHVASRFIRGEKLELAAHALSALTGVWLLAGIIIDLIRVNEDRIPVFSPQGLTTLGVVVLGAVAYFLVRDRGQREVNFAYALGLHFGFLGWTWQEIGLIPGGSGNGYVSIMWGVYAVALVVAGLRLGRNIPLLTCGITTLFALAAKLLLIDLQYVDAIWRILLFLGFGGFFLLFSYFFQGAIPGSEQRQVRS